DPRGDRPRARAHRRLRLVRNPRAPAPLVTQKGVLVDGKLRPRDSPRDPAYPDPALPAHAQELRVDEEDAEARAEDERDPGQVQEVEDRRGAAAETEPGADGPVFSDGLNPEAAGR